MTWAKQTMIEFKERDIVYKMNMYIECNRVETIHPEHLTYKFTHLFDNYEVVDTPEQYYKNKNEAIDALIIALCNIRDPELLEDTRDKND